MSQSTKTALRIIGTIMMIAGAIAFVIGLLTGGTTTPGGTALVIGGAVVLALGIIIDSIADGGIFILLRLVGGTTSSN